MHVGVTGMAYLNKCQRVYLKQNNVLYWVYINKITSKN